MRGISNLSITRMWCKEKLLQSSIYNEGLTKFPFSHPICCLVGFSIDMIDIPRDELLKKSLL